MGNRDAGVGDSGERALEEEPAVRELGIADLMPETPPAVPLRDFRIVEAHRIGQGGLQQKSRDNIAAIRTLRLVEAEKREALETEKAVLARYSGWGALPNVFHPYPGSEWADMAREVREELSGPEYESARASTPNAHFTSVMVIATLWQAMERLGLGAGANILEPSMGVGHFFGLMPENLLRGCRRTGVELDNITARIAQILYPDATIFAKSF